MADIDVHNANRGEIIIYRAEDNTIQLDVRMENETVWLTASQMAQLFGKEESNIRRHIINVFRDEEVERENNVHFLHVNGVKKAVRGTESAASVSRIIKNTGRNYRLV